MPRQSRTVFGGLAHHIAQRGNRRENVFFNDDDRVTYLTWLQEYCAKYGVEILAYCLMDKHIHLVAVPEDDDGLHHVLKPLHMRYAQRINRAHGWRGHLWQGRFFSSPLDESYLWAAVRYVERKPVRAGMVKRAQDYQWSSAAAHCHQQANKVLNLKSKWGKAFVSIPDWSAWLAEGDEDSELALVRRNIERGLPCGSDAFVKKLSKLAGRTLDFRPQGRPRTPVKSFTA